MVVMYPLAVVQELVNTPTGIINAMFDTRYSVPLPHKDPVE
jgi:hypothetical protein